MAISLVADHAMEMLYSRHSDTRWNHLEPGVDAGQAGSGAPETLDFQEWMEHVVHGFEAVGVVCLVLGSVWGLAAAVPAALRGDVTAAYTRARQLIGRSILLGLEILIVADIVQTITIDASLESAATLGLIVLVRTFLSFSLEIELEGVAPWRRWTLREEPEPTSSVSRR